MKTAGTKFQKFTEQHLKLCMYSLSLCVCMCVYVCERECGLTPIASNNNDLGRVHTTLFENGVTL